MRNCENKHKHSHTAYEFLKNASLPLTALINISTSSWSKRFLKQKTELCSNVWVRTPFVFFLLLCYWCSLVFCVTSWFCFPSFCSLGTMLLYITLDCPFLIAPSIFSILYFCVFDYCDCLCLWVLWMYVTVSE